MIGRIASAGIDPPAFPATELETGARVSGVQQLASRAKALFHSLRIRQVAGLLKTRTRRLRVAETTSLGEKRFVAIIEVDGVSFLIGGGSTNVALLAQLPSESASGAFSDSLQQASEAQGIQ